MKMLVLKEQPPVQNILNEDMFFPVKPLGRKFMPCYGPEFMTEIKMKARLSVDSALFEAGAKRGLAGSGRAYQQYRIDRSRPVLIFSLMPFQQS